MYKVARFVAKWDEPCNWCGGIIMSGDEASFRDRSLLPENVRGHIVHYECRMIEEF